MPLGQPQLKERERERERERDCIMSEEEEAPVLSSHRRATVIRIDVRIQVNRYGSLNVCTYVYSG